MFFGEYSDGKSTKVEAVEVKFLESELLVTGFNFQFSWDYQQINKTEKTNTHFSLFKGEKFPFEQVVLDDPSAFDYFQKIAPNAAVLKDYHLLFAKKGTKSYLAAIAGIGLVLALFHFLIIPALVTGIAKSFPKNLEQKIGENYFSLANRFGLIDTTKTQLLQEFANKLNFDTDYPLEFHVIESDMVNAFALPGGKIVVFSALLDSMTDYSQLVSLMGHETGHVALRHSLKSIFREQSYAVVLGALTSGNNAMIDGISDMASSLNSLHGSRKFEQQADNYAIKVLTLNHCNPYGAVELFEIFSNLQGQSVIPDFLSTHPSPAARIQELNEQIKALPSAEYIENPKLKALFKELQKKDTIIEEPVN